MRPLLRVAGLRYRYPTGFSVGPLDLEMGPGLTHLRGANGSGKTTMLRCLCGGLRHSEGEILVLGQDPRTTPDARRHVALLGAEPELPDFLSVDEAWQDLATIRGVPGWDGATLRDRLDLAGDLLLSQASAGQRRLAELLAASAGDPSVMLLDEPFANLDPDRAARVRALIEEWRAIRAVVVTSHLPLPMDADRVVTVGPSPGQARATGR